MWLSNARRPYLLSIKQTCGYTAFFKISLSFMSSAFSYSTTYILDKSHFSETYDASAVAGSQVNRYIASLLLGLAGLVLLIFTDLNPYAAWFIVAIAGLEVFSLRFRKSWWLARQMLSKAANNKLTLLVDEQGISTQSIHVNSQINWQDINKIEKTSQGWLFYQGKTKSYLSDRCLSQQASQFITDKARLMAQR